MPNNILLAFVGMPGSGKSEAVSFIAKKNIPVVRFGDLTDEALQKKGLERNSENEQIVREELRKEEGMAVYAIKAKPRIEQLFLQHAVVVIDGLYSWEEYVYLKKEFSQIILIYIAADRAVRYARLAERLVRPLTHEEAEKRDISEIEHINKGGPIAIADYFADNNGDKSALFAQLETILHKEGVSI